MIVVGTVRSFPTIRPLAPAAVLVPVVVRAVGVAITAFIAYRVVRAGVRDGIQAARSERDPGRDQFE